MSVIPGFTPASEAASSHSGRGRRVLWTAVLAFTQGLAAALGSAAGGALLWWLTAR